MSTIYIPKKLKVGFQKREDTFTKRLAYVIYYDEKNVLRKEKSWEGWRDKKIDPEEYANLPQTGYILNKNVQRSRDWGSSGRTLFRVFHPDGFEFEISGDNLINLLMHSDISKREIMQECVLAWGGTELILMPTNSELYQESVAYTDMQTEKLTKDDFVVGCEYIKRKDGLGYMYLGKFNHITGKYSHENLNDGSYYDRTHITRHTQVKTASPKHFFISVSSDRKLSRYDIGTASFSLFAQRATDTPSAKVAEYIDILMTTAETSPIVKFESTQSSVPQLDVSGYWRYDVKMYINHLINDQTMTKEHVSLELVRDPNAQTISEEDKQNLDLLRKTPQPIWDTTDYDFLLLRITSERDTQHRNKEQYAIDDKHTMSRVAVRDTTTYCVSEMMKELRAMPNKTVLTRGQSPHEYRTEYATWGDVKAVIKRITNNSFEIVTMVTEDGRTVQHGPMTI